MHWPPWCSQQQRQWHSLPSSLLQPILCVQSHPQLLACPGQVLPPPPPPPRLRLRPPPLPPPLRLERRSRLVMRAASGSGAGADFCQSPLRITPSSQTWLFFKAASAVSPHSCVGNRTTGLSTPRLPMWHPMTSPNCSINFLRFMRLDVSAMPWISMATPGGAIYATPSPGTPPKRQPKARSPFAARPGARRPRGGEGREQGSLPGPEPRA
mmetsp:Transcript_54616/g.154770  ORF Transcript_54616/g.154770 Transcript_54616/m.154770 type:complete len:211 (+) Transcript_54616:42-674(+)